MSPTSADFALMLANLEGIKNKIWTKAQAVEFFNDVESMVNTGGTWMSLTQWVMKRVTLIRDTFGVEIVFLSTYLELPEFAQGGLISEYDKYLLLQHIKHQRERVIALF